MQGFKNHELQKKNVSKLNGFKDARFHAALVSRCGYLTVIGNKLHINAKHRKDRVSKANNISDGAVSFHQENVPLHKMTLRGSVARERLNSGLTFFWSKFQLKFQIHHTIRFPCGMFAMASS
eukprot:2264280-Amphidinium_carterae.1